MKPYNRSRTALTVNITMNKKLLLILTLSGCSLLASAQSVLSLDSCRALALRNNKELAQSRVKIEKTGWDRKAAHTNYLPKVSLTAGYMRSGDEISLLSSDQKSAFNNMGTNLVNGFNGQYAGQFNTILQQVVTKYPDLAPLVQDFSKKLPQLQGALAQAGNQFGHGITDALRTDTRNMTAGVILLTQPLYMGGKIKAYENITKYQELLAKDQLRADELQVLLDVDKAYWQVVSLANKRKLAVSYRDMLAHLDSDVVKMINEGVATKSNELSVSVKLNEAEMTLMKVDDGLTLSRMLLCQLCGLPLESAPTLVDEENTDLPTVAENVIPDVQTAYANRAEIAQLTTAQNIYAEKAKVERAAVLPQLALTGGYMISNPNVFNSFEKKFRRVDQKAGLFAYLLFPAIGAQLLAQRRRPAALPDDRVIHGAARFLFPDDRRLALVGDADGGDVLHLHAAHFHGLLQRGDLGVQDVLGVVLHPARLGIVLLELDGMGGQDSPGFVKDDSPAGRGSLIQGDENVPAHGVSSL